MLLRSYPGLSGTKEILRVHVFSSPADNINLKAFSQYPGKIHRSLRKCSAACFQFTATRGDVVLDAAGNSATSRFRLFDGACSSWTRRWGAAAKRSRLSSTPSNHGRIRCIRDPQEGLLRTGLEASPINVPWEKCSSACRRWVSPPLVSISSLLRLSQLSLAWTRDRSKLHTIVNSLCLDRVKERWQDGKDRLAQSLAAAAQFWDNLEKDKKRLKTAVLAV